MRFRGVVYRAHDPRWAFAPLSGAGAEKSGGRFNPKGVAALYTCLAVETLFKEQTQGLSRKFDPLTICSYEVDCDDIVDLSSDAVRMKLDIAMSDLGCAWKLLDFDEKPVPSWRIAEELIAAGTAGILVPSFAPGVTDSDVNLVLWTWGDALPHKITPYDPHHRLPKNSRSWSPL